MRPGRIAPAVDHDTASPRELFFDLVFVFAFTQVATLLARPDLRGIGRGVLVLAALVGLGGYAWFTRRRQGRRRRRTLLVALIAMFVRRWSRVFGEACSASRSSSSA